MVRRPVAGVVAAVLFVEALGLAFVNWFLGVVVDRQDMSLAGLDPHTMSVSSKAAGVVFGLYFALCALAALLVAVRDRAPSGFWRVLLVTAAVVHALLGAFAIGPLGWGVFACMMLVLGLILLTLMTYDRPARTDGPGDSDAPKTPENGGTEAVVS
ncbi:hypothetical protein AB0L85_05525 [Streptomyces sp. NPDC052051]|uniref:hypothetical protein n=1 Tax=Streptomyces sp. NPDC052051 TaxID=3154649 RepID=UPI003432F546